MQANYDAAHGNAVQIRQTHDKLIQDIESLEIREMTIKAKAQEQVNKATAGMSSSASIFAFEQLEERSNRMLDAATADAQLNAETHSMGDLAAKYTAGGTSSADAELTRMKAELGI